jgi:hypothetical protein
MTGGRLGGPSEPADGAHGQSDTNAPEEFAKDTPPTIPEDSVRQAHIDRPLAVLAAEAQHERRTLAQRGRLVGRPFSEAA